MHSVTAGSLLAGRFLLDDAAPAVADGVRLGTGRDRVLDRPVAILLDDAENADEVIDAARRASLIDDNRFARVVDAGRDPSGVAYVVSELPAGSTLGELAGRVDAATARAIVGEAAAALEAARRRGVHHGALDPSRVVVTAEGGVVITGLGFLAVAEGLEPEHEDPVETSLARSRTDARELARLLGYLETGTPPEAVTARANAGEVMRSLAPWGEITLPTTGARKSVPLWRRVASPAPAPDAPPPAAPTEPPTVVPPPPPPPDTSQWAPRRSHTADGAPPGFEELLVDARSVTSAASPATAPAHAADVPPTWKILLPATSGASPADPEDVPLPAAQPVPDPEVRRAGAGLKDSAVRASAAAAVRAWNAPRSEEILPEEAPSDEAPSDEAPPDEASSEEVTSDRSKGAALAATAAAAARTASEKVQAGGAQVKEHAERARVATVKAATVSLEKLDTFVARHDIHVPGEIETQENAELPFSERRLDPGPFVLVLVVAAVATAAVLAMLNLMTIGGGGAVSETTVAATAAPTAAPTAETNASTPGAEVAPPATVVVPVVASLGVLDPQGDGGENPDLAPRAFDGDPATFWRSRSYVNPAYGMKQGIGLDLTLAEPALVSEITLTLMGTGGHVQVKADPADPVNGAVLVEADMGPTTVLTLPEPTELSHVVLWFTSLPVADSDGKNRVELAEVAVR